MRDVNGRAEILLEKNVGVFEIRNSESATSTSPSRRHIECGSSFSFTPHEIHESSIGVVSSLGRYMSIFYLGGGTAGATAPNDVGHEFCRM